MTPDNAGSEVNVGVYVNNRAAVLLEDYPLERLLEMAVEVEELGFHSVWVGESLLAKPRFSPMVTLAAIAAKTRRVKLGTSILQPLLRHPLLLAQEWATLDVISGGRTILGAGVGAGGPAALSHELANVGIRQGSRGRMFEEYLAVLRRLWTEPAVSHEGEFFRLDGVDIGYRGLQKPHPPIWVAAGGYNPRDQRLGRHGRVPPGESGKFHGPFDRVAKRGDGWLTAQPTPDEYASAWCHIQDLARERYQRDPSGIHPALVLWVNINDDRSVARQEARGMLEAYHGIGFDEETIDRYVLHGSGQTCLERLAEYIAAGARTIILVPASTDHPSQIRRVAREILPYIHGNLANRGAT